MKSPAFLRDLYFKLRYGFKGVPVALGSISIRFDESLRRWNFSSEKKMHDVLSSKLLEGDICIDIGANFGIHTLFASKLVGERGKVFSFEPAPENYELLKRNIVLNGFKNVEVITKAVSNSSASYLEFFIPDRNGAVSLTASLIGDGDKMKTIKVGNTTLDDFWKKIDLPVKLIKIDVEGAELDVIKGAINLVSKYKPILLIEVHGFAFPSFGYSLEIFNNYLSNIGYTENKLEYGPGEGEEYFQAWYTCNKA